MLDKLQNIGYTIWTMKIHIALLLTHESLIALGFEELPGTD
jgi:hypothetical protein